MVSGWLVDGLWMVSGWFATISVIFKVVIFKVARKSLIVQLCNCTPLAPLMFAPLFYITLHQNTTLYADSEKTTR